MGNAARNVLTALSNGEDRKSVLENLISGKYEKAPTESTGSSGSTNGSGYAAASNQQPTGKPVVKIGNTIVDVAAYNKALEQQRVMTLNPIEQARSRFNQAKESALSNNNTSVTKPITPNDVAMYNYNKQQINSVMSRPYAGSFQSNNNAPWAINKDELSDARRKFKAAETVLNGSGGIKDGSISNETRAMFQADADKYSKKIKDYEDYYGKTDWVDVLKAGAKSGLNQANKFAGQTMDYLFGRDSIVGGLAHELKVLGAQTINDFGGNIDIEQMDRSHREEPGYFEKEISANDKNIEAANDQFLKSYGSSKIAEELYKTTSNTIMMLPYMLETALEVATAVKTGGLTSASLADNFGLAGTELLNHISTINSSNWQAVLSAMAKNGLAQVIKRPGFWNSFGMVLGDSYNTGKENGMSELGSSAYAITNAFLNAEIEVGGADLSSGGIQSIVSKTGGKDKWYKIAAKWFKEVVLGEAKEEIEQGVISRAGIPAFGGNSASLFSTTDPNAIINPGVMYEEGKAGAIGGLIFGGANSLTKSIPGIINPSNTTESPSTDSVSITDSEMPKNQSAVQEASEGDLRAVPGTLVATQAETPESTQEATSEPSGELNTATNPDLLQVGENFGRIIEDSKILQTAIRMINSGKTAKAVYNSTGLLLKDNGDITDGIGGKVLFEADKGSAEGGVLNGRDTEAYSSEQSEAAAAAAGAAPTATAISAEYANPAAATSAGNAAAKSNIGSSENTVLPSTGEESTAVYSRGRPESNQDVRGSIPGSWEAGQETGDVSIEENKRYGSKIYERFDNGQIHASGRRLGGHFPVLIESDSRVWNAKASEEETRFPELVSWQKDIVSRLTDEQLKSENVIPDELLPQELLELTSAIRTIVGDRDYKVKYTYGKPLGEESAQGLSTKDGIFLNAEAPIVLYTLAVHESFHAKLGIHNWINNYPSVTQIADSILRTVFGNDVIDNQVDKIRKAYDGRYDIDDNPELMYLEEILANSYSSYRNEGKYASLLVWSLSKCADEYVANTKLGYGKGGIYAANSSFEQFMNAKESDGTSRIEKLISIADTFNEKQQTTEEKANQTMAFVESDDDLPFTMSDSKDAAVDKFEEDSRLLDGHADVEDYQYNEQRWKDKNTQDNAKGWAYGRSNSERTKAEAENREIDPEIAWQNAERDFGAKNHQAIVDAADKAISLNTLYESDSFAQRTSISIAKSAKERVSDFKNKMLQVSDGTIPFEDFVDYYSSIKGDRLIGDFFSPKVDRQMQRAKEYLADAIEYGTPADVLKFSHQATRAMQMMAHSFKQSNEAIIDSWRIADGLKGRDAVFGKNKKGLLTRYQINPSNMFRSIDGFKKWEGGIGYDLQKQHDDATAVRQQTEVEAQNHYLEVKQMDGFFDFITGKQKSDITIGNIDLTMSQAADLYKILKTLYAQGGYRADTISGIALKNGSSYDTITKDMLEGSGIRDLYISAKKAVESSDVASAYVKATDEMLEEFSKKLQDTAVRTNGVESYMYSDGSYMPIKYLPQNQSATDLDIEDDIDLGLNSIGIMEERTRKAGGTVIIQPINEVIDSYISQASDYVAYNEFGDRLSALDRISNLGGKGISQLFGEAYGDTFKDWTKEFVDDVNRIHKDDRGGVNKFLGDIRQKFQTGVLIGSVSVPLKQVASYWNAMSVLSPESLLKAYRVKLAPARGFGKNNPLLQYRKLGNIDPTASDVIKESSTAIGKLKSKSKLLTRLANGISTMDYRTVDNLYTATVYDVQSKNPDLSIGSEEFERLVNEKFQEVVLNTQPIYTKNARAEYMRTDNEGVKMLAMFRTQQTQNFNSLINSIEEYKAAKGTSHEKEAKSNAARTVSGVATSSLSFALLSMLADLILHKHDKYKDDDDEVDERKIVERLALNVAEAASGTVWFGDSVAKALIETASGGEYNEFYGISSGALSSLTSVLTNITNFGSNPGLYNAKRIAGDISSILGIPINNAYSILNASIMWSLDALGKNKAISSEAYGISEEGFDDILRLLDSSLKDIRNAAPDSISFDGVDYILSASDKREYRSDRKERYNALLEASIGKKAYDALTTEQKAEINNSLRSKAKNDASQNFLDSKGLGEMESRDSWETDVPDKSTYGFLAAKSIVKSLYDKDKNITDYDAMDKFLSDRNSIYAALNDSSKEALESQYSRLDDMYRASAEGITSEEYDKAYKVYKSSLDNDVDSNSSEALAVEIAKLGYGEDKTKWLIENLRTYTTHPVNIDSFYELADSFGKTSDNSKAYEKAAMVTSTMRNLEPLPTHNGITNAQKYRAIAEADLTDEEKWIAFSQYGTDAAQKEASKYKSKGYTYEQWVNIPGNEKTELK